jgi:hypothetical protein
MFVATGTKSQVTCIDGNEVEASYTEVEDGGHENKDGSCVRVSKSAVQCFPLVLQPKTSTSSHCQADSTPNKNIYLISGQGDNTPTKNIYPFLRSNSWYSNQKHVTVLTIKQLVLQPKTCTRSHDQAVNTPTKNIYLFSGQAESTPTKNIYLFSGQGDCTPTKNVYLFSRSKR